MQKDNPLPDEPTVSKIIHAAYDLFLQHGYHGTSMRQIAQQTGIAVASIYNHFPNKEEIFLAVLLAHHPYIKTLPALQQAEGKSAEAFFRDAAQRMVAALGDRLEFINLMFIELVEFDGKHLPMLFQQFFPQIQAFAQRLTVHHPDMRPIPAIILVRIFLGLFYSYALTEVLIARQIPENTPQESFEAFMDVFLNGILLKEASKGEHAPSLTHP